MEGQSVILLPLDSEFLLKNEKNETIANKEQQCTVICRFAGKSHRRIKSRGVCLQIDQKIRVLDP